MAAMTDAQKVINAQARAQARADAAAIEMKRVRAFLRMALPDNAVIPEPKRKQGNRHVQQNRKSKKPLQNASGFIVGQNFHPTDCKCLAWEGCTCGLANATT